MKTTSKIIIIGLVFILTIIGFIWGFSFLKGNSLLKKDYSYYAIYSNVSGLTSGSAVTISGYQVGQIMDISFTNDKIPKVVVHFILEKPIKIPKNSIAEIYSRDLMGTKAIRIIFNPNSTEYYSVGDTLVAAVEKDLKDEVNEQILPLKIRTEQLLSSFDSVLVLVQALFSKNENHIYSSINNINLTIKNLEHTTFVIDTMLTNPKGRINKTITALAALSATLSKSNDTLEQILANLNRISDSLANADLKQLVNNTKKSIYNLNKILEQIRSEQGSLGKFVYDDSLYNSIVQLSENLNYLLEDFKQQPKRYLNISLINLGRYYAAPEKKAKDN